MLVKKKVNPSCIINFKNSLRESRLNTVCETAKCPNIGECFSKGTATFLILGDTCTRSCSFCAVNKGSPAEGPDPAEPRRVAEMVKKLNIKYAVITSVTRDDLPDGGAAHYKNTVNTVKACLPGVKIEVLVPDFKGDSDSLAIVLSAKPDVLNHNLETVERLYPRVRPGAGYERSLSLIKKSAQQGFITKSGLMLGLGETEMEVLETMADLKKNGCGYITLGQYLAPSKSHYPVKEYISDIKFDFYKNAAHTMGFKKCASGTYVRSSYLAEELHSEPSMI